MIRRPMGSTLFPTRRSSDLEERVLGADTLDLRRGRCDEAAPFLGHRGEAGPAEGGRFIAPSRSEEHTSELQSLTNLVCRLLLEKKKKKTKLEKQSAELSTQI